MGLECKLEILEEKKAITEFYKEDFLIIVKCLDNEIRDKIYNKFGNSEYHNNAYSYRQNNKYVCNKHYNETLIIAEKNEFKDYILNEIGDKEMGYVCKDDIWIFSYWLEKELNLKISETLSSLCIIQLDIQNERLKQEQENKAKAMNLIDELF